MDPSLLDRSRGTRRIVFGSRQVMFDLIEEPLFNMSHKGVLTCGSTRVTQKLDPHSLVEPVVLLLEVDLRRC